MSLFSLHKKPKRIVCPGCWRSDAPLVSLTKIKFDNLTISDFFEHVAIFGTSGSGKTSGPGEALAEALLKFGFGGVICCAKAEEALRWERYCRKYGRDKSFLRFGASGQYRFNFLDYIMKLPREQGGGQVDNAVNALLHIIEAGQASEARSTGGGGSSDFWRKALRQILAMSIASLYHAYGRVRLDELVQLVNTAPTSEEQARSPDFQTTSFLYSTLRKLFHDPKVPLPLREAKLLASYFGQTFARLDSKTRSNIVMTLSTEIDPFLREPLHTLFCTDTNITPEVTHEGVILVLDLPVKRFEHVGVVVQVLMKYLWQKATERREITDHTRPVFLFADEAHLFLSSYDMEFLSTARSAKTSTIYITQNLPQLYASMGGMHPQDRVDALLGNFGTKIFCANTCSRTNQWAADMIGKAVQRRASRNWSQSDSSQTNEGASGNWGVQDGENRGRSWGWSSGVSWSDSGGPVNISYGSNSGGQNGTSRSRSKGGGWSRGTGQSHSDSDGGGWSEQMDYVIQPADFANKLRQGGPRNDFIVTGILLQANRVFSRTGTCWTPVAFKQR